MAGRRIGGRSAESTCPRASPMPHSKPGLPAVTGGHNDAGDLVILVRFREVKGSIAMRSSRYGVAIASGPLLAATLLCGGCVVRGAAVAPERFCPGGSSPDPNVLLCENFEDDGVRARWDIGDHNGMLSVSQFRLCTDDTAGFNDRCAAWSNRLIFDHEWGFYGHDARRPFPPQSEFYVRWYQYTSNPYAWGTLEDKSVLLHDRENTITAYVGSSRN